MRPPWSKTSGRPVPRVSHAAAEVDRLNVGPIPTWQLSWDQPHEGNLFDHLYARRAFQRHRVSDLALPEFGPNQSVQR